jgi:hypothetical protein
MARTGRLTTSGNTGSGDQAQLPILEKFLCYANLHGL